MLARPMSGHACARRGARFLLNTALASTLCALAAGTPHRAYAVDQVIVDQRVKVFDDTRHVNNSGKTTSIVDTLILNTVIVPTNNLSGSNPGAAGARLFQLMDFTEIIRLHSEIDVTNSGFIDPLIGIRSRISNSGGSLANNAAMSNANSASFAGDVSQQLALAQSNAIAGSISTENTGKIVASQFGIYDLIDNLPIGSLANNVAASNANAAAAAVALNDLTQGAEFAQSNTIASGISLLNSGDLTAAVGIQSAVNTVFTGSLANNAAVSNASGDAFAVSLSDVQQSITLGQSNTLTANITVSNSGDYAGSDTGIAVGVRNATIGSIANNAAASNANASAIALSLPDQSQSIDLDQLNAITSLIGIENSGGMSGGNFGLSAKIENQNIGNLANNFGPSGNANAAANLVGVDDIRQLLELEQGNTIESVIDATSSGNVNVADTAIRVAIETVSLSGLRNFVDTSSLNGDAALLTAGSLLQSADVDQSNVVSSALLADNEGEVNSATGIAAQIATQSTTLNNQATVANINGTATLFQDEGVTQSLDLTQTNNAISTILAQNGGTLTASGTGISALIDNAGLNLANTAVVELRNDATTVLNDVEQTARVAQSNVVSSSVTVLNAGTLTAGDVGVWAQILNDSLSLSNSASGGISNNATVNGDSVQTGSVMQVNRVENTIEVVNSGRIWGGNLGIFASVSDGSVTMTENFSVSGASLVAENTVKSAIRVDNTGAIGAGNLFAIDTAGASTTVTNRGSGVITGFIDLSDEDDVFDNQSGAAFEARMTSDFGAGDDRFANQGTVHAIAIDGVQPSFVNLEEFENDGLISTVNGSVGDVFTLSGPGLQFVARGDSKLALDAFLGPPGSTADNLVINGNVFGQTALLINNTNPGGGAVNKQGIPVVFVNAPVVDAKSFYLTKPVDAGAFDYDLFFVPTGSGFFELRSFPGGGAHHLPHLVTAVQDIFHIGTETWFDRTADLRVLLNGGEPSGGSVGEDGARLRPSFTPAIWFKGSGSWLEQNDKATVSAYDRTYRYNLGRELDVWNLEGGIDFGRKNVLAEGDALVLGLLGGAIVASLDYDELARQFDITGGEAGVYATYLNGGLFVDNLFKTALLELDPGGTPGYSGPIDAVASGIRTDAGYRFGGFRRGPFVEPLATIAVVWSDLDNLTVSGNQVRFDEGTNVRGRLGLRVGTSGEVWRGIRMEPFVIGSLWSTLSGDNRATLTSLGTTFPDYVDEPDDLWGVASAGVNFFNPTARTSLFAKLDVTFGEETTGASAKAGARINW
jgi:hypothetical protein